MTITEWTNQNWNEMGKIAKKIGGFQWEDLRAEVALIILEKENVQDIIDSGGALFYFTRICLNQFKSNTSGFAKYYRNMYQLPENWDAPDLTESDSREALYCQIEEALEKLPNYDRRVFEIKVLEGESICKLARETGIPRNSLSLTFNRAKQFLQKEIKKQNQNL